MTDKRLQEQAGQSNMEKDPQDWVTGDEPMTGAQRSYLKTLSEEAKEPFDDSLTKAQASRRIEELQARTGRGAAGAPKSAPSGAAGGDGSDAAATAPPDEGPLESLGRAVGEAVVGALVTGGGRVCGPVRTGAVSVDGCWVRSAGWLRSGPQPSASRNSAMLCGRSSGLIAIAASIAASSGSG